MAEAVFKDIELTAEGRKYLEEIEKLTNLEIRVGFQQGDGDYDDGTSVVDVAAFNEFGSSRTPARPFMRQSFENREEDLLQMCAAAVTSIAKGSTAKKELNKLGVFAKGVIQDEIAEGTFAPNAPSTIERKGSDKPLIDTGFMRQSVNYTINKR